MKRIVLVMLVLFSGFSAFAQIDNRVEVEGTIYVPSQEDPEGVSIFNLNSNRGAISNENGAFKLKVKVNDSIRVTSLQFQAFTVLIRETVVSSKKLNIYLNEVINPLPEVVVSPYDLSGNINVDVKRLESRNYAKNLKGTDLMNATADISSGPNL